MKIYIPIPIRSNNKSLLIEDDNEEPIHCIRERVNVNKMITNECKYIIVPTPDTTQHFLKLINEYKEEYLEINTRSLVNFNLISNNYEKHKGIDLIDNKNIKRSRSAIITTNEIKDYSNTILNVYYDISKHIYYISKDKGHIYVIVYLFFNNEYITYSISINNYKKCNMFKSGCNYIVY